MVHDRSLLTLISEGGTVMRTRADEISLLGRSTMGVNVVSFGPGTRLAALATGVNMLVATLMVHAKFGFFMNWTGTQKGEGFEYHILAIAIAAALTIAGAGRWSVDRMLATK